MSSALRTLLRVTAFPLLFGGAGYLAWIGYSPEAITWLMPALVGTVILLTRGLERIVPYTSRWNSGPGAGADVFYIGASSVVVAIAEAATWAFAVMLAGALAADGLSIWPTQWPIVGQVFLALAIGDLLPYLYHRASHESSGFLWRVHAIHHAPERLYALNFARFHPINAFLTAALTLLPLVVLGAPAPLLFAAGVLHNVHGVLSHANVDFRLGPLNAIFSMAELHRWHHARDPQLANGNYGATVLLWDWIFGTRRHPPALPDADGVGLWTGSTIPPGILAQWKYPFAGMREAIARRIRVLMRVRCCAGRSTGS